MSELDFLSPDGARTWRRQPALRSPLARALAASEGLGIEDVSLAYGKLEVRGDVRALDVEADVVPITPQRALVLCAYDRTVSLRHELREQVPCIDMTAALAGLRVRGSALMRRLTDLDLDHMPAAGAVAGVPALVVRRGDDFEVFFRQEYGDHVGRVAIDAAHGLAS